MPRMAITAHEYRPGGLFSLQPVGALLFAIGLVVCLASRADAQDDPASVFIVHIRGTIDLGLAPHLSRILQQAEREGAPAVILEIDTPGGRLDAVLQMRDAILASPVRTIAFVNRSAFSAGALVTIAAQDVYMAPGAVIGAATPVSSTGEPADEKVVSAVRTMFKSTAELRGRDPRIAEAMVDPSVEIDGLVERGQLLTITTTEALAWGYADGVVGDRRALLQAVGLPESAIQENPLTWAENLVRFLTSPEVASLLISAGLLLILFDFLSGGIGLASAAGASLLAVFFWGHMLVGLAGWEGVSLVVLGLTLLGLEVFVIPGFGVTGILGLLALAGGLFVSLIGETIITNEDIVRAGSTVGFALILIIVGGAFLLWLLPRSGRLDGLVLKTRLGVPDDPPRRAHLNAARHDPPAQSSAPLSGGDTAVRAGSLLGERGVAISDLRPGGFGDFNGERVDVVTRGDYISAGEPIEIISDEAYRRVVKRSEPGTHDAARSR